MFSYCAINSVIFIGILEKMTIINLFKLERLFQMLQDRYFAHERIFEFWMTKAFNIKVIKSVVT